MTFVLIVPATNINKFNIGLDKIGKQQETLPRTTMLETRGKFSGKGKDLPINSVLLALVYERQ